MMDEHQEDWRSLGIRQTKIEVSLVRPALARLRSDAMIKQVAYPHYKGLEITSESSLELS